MATRVRFHQWTLRLVLLIGGIAVGLVVAEGAARVFGIGEMPRPRRAVYAGQSREWCCGPEVIVDGLQRFEPGSHFQHCYSGAQRSYFDAQGCVTYSINNWGYRGADFEVSKPLDTYRIVVLGDSFTFGEGTPDADVFPHLLASGLSSQPSWSAQFKRIEVINLGIPAADTRSETATYARFARTLQPDWVIVQWNTNDYPTSRVQQDHLKLIGARYRDLFTEPASFGWSRLVTFARLQWRMREISNDLIATTRSEAKRGQGILEGLSLMARMAAEDQSRFSVLIFPELINFSDYPYASILEIVHTYCRDRQIEVIDLLSQLADHRDRDLWVHETDHHPNPTAHAIAAEALLAVAQR